MEKLGSFITAIIVCVPLLSLSHPAVWAGDATLSWNPPTTNVDGTPATDLAGYKVYYGTASGTYTQAVDAGLTITPVTPTYTVTNLVTGNTYYFAVTAYDTSGIESGFSDEVSKFIGSTTGSGGGEGQSAVSGGGGCGMIKDITGRSGHDDSRVALNLSIPVLLLMLLKMYYQFRKSGYCHAAWLHLYLRRQRWMERWCSETYY
jgi:hypothetical protein